MNVGYIITGQSWEIAIDFFAFIVPLHLVLKVPTVLKNALNNGHNSPWDFCNHLRETGNKLHSGLSGYFIPADGFHHGAPSFPGFVSQKIPVVDFPGQAPVDRSFSSQNIYGWNLLEPFSPSGSACVPTHLLLLTENEWLAIFWFGIIP